MIGGQLQLDAAKAIYRAAIDPQAADGEGSTWWEEVREELDRVLAAPTLAEAAGVIAWWHNDWAAVRDTARSAAKRIRDEAARLRKQARSRTTMERRLQGTGPTA